MLNKKQMIDVLNSGLSTGADYAEIFIEDRFNSSIIVENGKTNQITSSRSYGAGVRLLKDLQSVYGYTNDVTHKGLSALAKSLANSFKGERLLSVENLKTKVVRDVHKSSKPYSETSNDEVIAYLKRGDNVMREYDKRIVRTNCGFINSLTNVTIVTSKGFIHKDSKERGRLVLSAIAFEGAKIENSFAGPGTHGGFEYFLNTLNIEELAKKTASNAIMMLDAKECPSGKMPVVIGNGFGGVIFHEACGHSLEASAVAKKLSVFSESLGTQIASPLVTAIDDGTIVNGWGSNNIDDEGNKTQKNVLIKDGILTSFLIDDFNGRRMGEKGNGACRRQNYRFEPTSRMSNTYIANGKSTPEEIIAATKLGLYAAELGGGSVNPATGEFNFACNVAYIIRDGKVCEPVRGATLIGSGKDILMKIDMVGNDLARAQGMCGASSGSIPTDVGQPTIRVSEITVGGNGGQLK